MKCKKCGKTLAVSWDGPLYNGKGFSVSFACPYCAHPIKITKKGLADDVKITQKAT